MTKQYINLSIAKGSLLLIFPFCIHLVNVHFLGFFTSWIRICTRIQKAFFNADPEHYPEQA